MNDASSIDGSAQDETSPAAEVAAFTQGEYQIQLYQGFVGRSTIAPRGRPTETLYQQEGTYRVPGGGAPSAVSNVVLTGGQHSRDVHLHVRNQPQDPATYKGPILAITVQLGQPTTGPVNNRPDLVQIVRGEEQVISIWVDTRAGGMAMAEAQDQAAAESGREPGAGPQEEPEETWTIEDNASTCPRNC